MTSERQHLVSSATHDPRSSSGIIPSLRSQCHSSSVAVRPDAAIMGKRGQWCRRLWGPLAQPLVPCRHPSSKWSGFRDGSALCNPHPHSPAPRSGGVCHPFPGWQALLKTASVANQGSYQSSLSVVVMRPSLLSMLLPCPRDVLVGSLFLIPRS